MNQREIKFRCWDKIGKTMWQNVHFDYTHIYSDKWNEKTETWLGQLPIWSGVLMQFTGLTDKNGKEKEVYQGDLIRNCRKGYEPREIYEVVWDEERLEWGVKNKFGLITSLWTFCKDFEVIGNVFENELLLTP